MRWDQIRYPDPEKNDLGDPDELDDDGNLANPVAARIRDINDPDSIDFALDQLKGHYVEDIGEGYEFRLEPLLVDGLSGDDDVPYPFGSQTHPNGFQDPQNHQEWDEIAVIRLVAGNVSLPGDCSGNGVLDVPDLSCVETITERDLVLGALNTLPGDLDGVDGVGFADFLKLSGNFGNATGSYADGNVDLVGGIEFADFLVLSGNFGKTAGGAATAVPEPTGIVLFGIGTMLLGLVRRKRLQL